MQLYQGLNMCDSFPLLSILYYYYNIKIQYIILQYSILYLLQFIELGSTSYIIQYNILHYIAGETLMELIFNPCDEFRLSPEDPFSQIHFPHLHDGAPAIFQGPFRC